MASSGEGREITAKRSPPIRWRAILGIVAERYPQAPSKKQVAMRAGYEASGGGFNNAVSRLRALEIISGTRDVRASEELFDA